MHAIDIEEEREHEHEHALVGENALRRGPQAHERVAEQVLGALLVMRLVHVLQHGHAENDPPRSGNHKGKAKTTAAPTPASSWPRPKFSPNSTSTRQMMKGTHEPM